MLMNHADAGGDRGARRAEFEVNAVDCDQSDIRAIDAGKNIHSGCLAGAVLAEQGNDATGRNVDCHAVGGAQSPEALGDVLQPNQRRAGESPSRYAGFSSLHHLRGILPLTPSTNQLVALRSAIASVFPSATATVPSLVLIGPCQ